MGDSTSSFQMAHAPMATDRTAGCSYFRDQGDVFESNGIYFLIAKSGGEVSRLKVVVMR